MSSAQDTKNDIPNHTPLTDYHNTDTHSIKSQLIGLVLLYTSIILVIALLVTVWYGYTIRKDLLISAQTTARKLQVIDEYSRSVQNEKKQFNRYIEIVQDPINTVAFWNIIQVNSQLDQLHASIETEYELIQKEQKQTLTDELKFLNQQLDKVTDLSLPSKTEAQIFSKQLQQSMQDNKLTVSEMTDYQASCKKRREKLQTETTELLSTRLAELEEMLDEHKGIEFPSKDHAIAYVNGLQEELQTSSFEEGVLLEQIKRAEEKTTLIEQEVEETKRQLVFATIENLAAEADTMLGFFTQRQGYDAEIEQLQAYKSTVAAYYEEAYAEIGADDIQKEAEENAYPFLEKPRQTKAAIEEEERRALIAQQRQSGIPEAPVKEGKLIVINVPNQRLYAYENGVSLFDYPVPVTTGKAGYDTVRGTFSIYHKATNFRMRSPFPDEWYDNMVSYWMPFYQGYGIHDAYWRSVYGTQDYPYVGSHGCVNTPFAEVERLYYWAEIGTPVIVL